MGTGVVKVMAWFGKDLLDDFGVLGEYHVEEL